MSLFLTVFITIIIFGLLISIHEFGHYIAARIFKVGIIEFSIGMGPRFLWWEGKNSDLSLRIFPIGGYLNMVGEQDEADIPEKSRGKASLNSKPVWQRMIVTLSGPLMNLILAFVVMTVLVSTSYAVGSTTVASFFDGSQSQSSLAVNDTIIKINEKNIHCYTEMAYMIMSDGYQPVDITVLRNGETLVLKDIAFKTSESNGVMLGDMDFKVFAKEKTFGNIVYESFWQSYSSVYMVIDQIGDTIRGRYGFSSLGGPVAVGEQVGEVVKESDGFVDTLRNLGSMLVIISVSLGICNLLPIPVLDGGRFLFYLIEAIRRKPMKKENEQRISSITAFALILLMAAIMFKDIIHLF